MRQAGPSNGVRSPDMSWADAGWTMSQLPCLGKRGKISTPQGARTQASERNRFISEWPQGRIRIAVRVWEGMLTEGWCSIESFRKFQLPTEPSGTLSSRRQIFLYFFWFTGTDHSLSQSWCSCSMFAYTLRYLTGAYCTT